MDISVTAQAHVKIRPIAQDIGMFIYLIKPLGDKELRQAIENVMLTKLGRKHGHLTLKNGLKTEYS